MHRACVFFFLMARFVLPADSSAWAGEAGAAWTQAAVKQDASGLRRYMAEDLQYAHAGGKTQTRDEYIAGVVTGPSHYESFTFSDVKVKVYGKVAELNGFVDVTMQGWGGSRHRSAASNHQ